MIGGLTRLGGFPGLPGRVTLSAGVTICHVNFSRWGNPPRPGRIHGKKLKSEVDVLFSWLISVDCFFEIISHTL